jgi:hypothetical protein
MQGTFVANVADRRLKASKPKWPLYQPASSNTLPPRALAATPAGSPANNLAQLVR